MQIEAYKAWLTTRGISENSIRTRTYSVNKIATSLQDLGFGSLTLDDLWRGGRFEAVDEKLQALAENASAGGQDFRVLLPESEKPQLRLRSFRSWLGQYRQFLEEQAGQLKRSDWLELERMRDEFLLRMPDFQDFQASTGSYFETERDYKDQIIAAVQTAINTNTSSPEQVGRACAAAMQTQSGPLIRWQTIDWFNGQYQHLAPDFFSAMGELALKPNLAARHIVACIKALTDLRAKGVSALTKGEILSIAFSVAGCAHPNQAVPFKIRKAQALTKRLLGEALFTGADIRSDDVSSWLNLLERMRVVMDETWSWQTRDLIDVQGFAWVVLDEQFALEEGLEMDIETEATPPSTVPQNIILYGPPGTGKTYTMAERAVQICDGHLPAADTIEARRDLIEARYRALRDRGRIEFVTFHQSYSYEEFVEGLRPETGTPDGEPSGAGFRLQAEDGIFRRIARRAQEARGKPQIEAELPRTNVFKTSLGPTWDESFAYLFEECIANGYILLGYGGEQDWSPNQYAQFANILKRWREIEPDATGNNPNVVQSYTLRGAMSVGDLVIVSNGNLRFRAIGRITGPYQFVMREDDEYHHRRSVEWLWVDRGDGLSHSDIYEKRFSQQTLYKMVDSAIKWPALQEIVTGSSTEDGIPPPYVLIIDEINRANISKVFGELITLLEPDKRLGAKHELKISLPYSKDEFGVPSNLHVIGTMNTADRSIALLDTALRRRFDFQELMPDASLLSPDLDGIDLQAVLEGLNDRIEYLFDRDHQIGHAYFMGCETRADVDTVMRLKVIPLLAEYFYENWERVRQVLGETKDAGAFITRQKLRAPATDQDRYDTAPRWRYTVNSVFLPDAYEQLSL
jgi:hypothetical protein